MSNNNPFTYSYRTQTGMVSGHFYIGQEPGGCIIMRMGNGIARLSLKQIRQLGIALQEIPEFNKHSFADGYDLSNLSEKELKQEVTQTVDEYIDTMFLELHERCRTKSGDISPDQIFELDEIILQLRALKFRLSELITRQIWQNVAEDD